MREVLSFVVRELAEDRVEELEFEERYGPVSGRDEDWSVVLDAVVRRYE